MSDIESIARHLPFLRRFGRSLTGSQTSGDAYVVALLEAAKADASVHDLLKSGRVGTYRAFCELFRSSSTNAGPSGKAVSRQRQAMLLTTLEEFTPSEAAEILGATAADIDNMIASELGVIDGESPARVLIIEDEPLISMQLEMLVSELGHEVCGMAATRTQAVELAKSEMPTIILADIQLADGSSGIDAVADILTLSSLPVVFITAYPEKLLTGETTEPAFLVTKPFQESTVRAAISQALFFAD